MTIASPESIANAKENIARGIAAQPALVEMWRNNLRKSQQTIPGLPTLPSVILINFGGAGQPLTVGMAGLAEITFPCRILGCHLYAGVWNLTTGFTPVSVTASVDLRLGSQGSWAGGTVPLVDSLPALVAQSESSPGIVAWHVTELQPGDLIPYALATFTGTATFLTLALPVLRLDVRGLGVSELTDGAGDDFTDAGGAPFTIRG